MASQGGIRYVQLEDGGTASHPMGTLLLSNPRGFCAGVVRAIDIVRLVEVAEHRGTKAYRISGIADIRPEWLRGARRIGITAGASTPEILVEQVLEFLKTQGHTRVDEVETVKEDVHFALPQELN